MRMAYRSMFRVSLLAALLAPARFAAAESPAPQGPGSAVVVNGGVAGPMADRYHIIAALEPLLWPGSASSCGFMAPYDPNYDPVTVAYMRDFGMLNSASYNKYPISETAPYGDASLRSHSLRRILSGCGRADLNFAAGRRHILMRDKSLAKGFDAFVRQDYVRARDEFTEAWNKIGYRGVPALMVARLHLYGLGTPQDTSKAIDRLKQAATAGYAPAQYHLALAYYSGDGVPRDLKLAGAYFDAAAHAGLAAAQFAAGRMVDQGEGVPGDPRKALVYYKDAALKGNRDAEFALGTYFYDGDVVGKDVATARKWFAAAARQGQPDAMFNVGVMTARGEGGARDPAVAYVWLTLAAQSGQKQAGAARDLLARSLSAEERKRADEVLVPKVATQ